MRTATGGDMTSATDGRDADALFVIAHNPQPDTRLPYLLRLPIEGGLMLKARDTWPRSSRIYCHRFEEDWPEDPDIIEAVPVSLSQRGEQPSIWCSAVPAWLAPSSCSRR
jgi:hypothetical protein